MSFGIYQTCWPTLYFWTSDVNQKVGKTKIHCHLPSMQFANGLFLWLFFSSILLKTFHNWICQRGSHSSAIPQSLVCHCCLAIFYLLFTNNKHPLWVFLGSVETLRNLRRQSEKTDIFCSFNLLCHIKDLEITFGVITSHKYYF